MKLREYQQILINILVNFDKYCRSKGIRYSLFGGTMLGAIRHKGIIPWDDDVDVIVPREDYKKLLKDYRDSRYLLLKPGDKNYFYPFAKLCDTNFSLNEIGRKGIMYPFIDVFPADAFDIRYFGKIHKIVRKIIVKGQTSPNFYKASNKYKQIVLNVYLLGEWIFTKFYSIQYLLKKINKILSEHPGKDYYKVVWGGTSKSKYDFDNLIETDFSDFKFYIFNNYDQLLSELYGNYMVLPKNTSPSHNLIVNGEPIE